MNDRVLVVGAGHNGLVCAVRLAAAGVPVTVLEQAPHPGGAVASDVATLPGFVHDSCAGFFPLTLASPAFERLGVRERLEWVNPDRVMAHPFPDGSAIALHRSLDATVESLERAAPGSGQGWLRVMAPLVERKHRVLRAALTDSFPPVRDGLALLASLRRDALELGRLALASSASFGREVFGDERATAWFSGSVAHADLTPGSSGGSALALGLKLLAHAVGWGYPKGGAARLAEALVARLHELGGELRCGAAVESVVVSGGRVRGVRLSDGEELAGAAAVVALSAQPALALLPPGALPGRLVRRLEHWRYGLGTMKADYALAGAVPWTNADARESAVVHVAGELPRLFEAHQQAGLGRMPERPVLVVGQHTLHDPSRAPDGRHTLYVYAHVPQRLDVSVERAADLIDAQIERFAPGFRDSVLARAVRSPVDIERLNPSLVGGDLSGGSCELDQQLIFRPAPELFRGRTPLAGLYLAGPSVHPGPGVHGVPGTAAARALLADRGLGRRLGRRAIARARRREG
jgi:phytoene dehydrogenase-like protein